MSKVAAIILSGGQGKRLFPLTENCCKPAICFGGHYRLIDVPISNAIHSGCFKVFILSQFLASSLHRHIYQNYPFHSDLMEMLTAEERPGKSYWFQGTADAVRQNLMYLSEVDADYFLILSGDQLYHLKFAKMAAFAKKTGADVTVAAKKVSQNEAYRLGILKKNKDDLITDFIEKPQSQSELEPFKLDDQSYLGSMGIYLFKKRALFELLENDSRHDFGKHLIPEMVKKKKAAAYLHQGYWEDIGTISSFYRANMDLAGKTPSFKFYDEKKPIFGAHFNLPGAKIEAEKITSSIVCAGSNITAKKISQSIIGPRSVIGKGSVIEESYLMGNDYYTPPKGSPLPKQLKIGRNCHIKKAIIDKNTSIGDNVRLVNEKNLSHYDGDGVFIRDGILIVQRGTILAEGFTL